MNYIYEAQSYSFCTKPMQKARIININLGVMAFSLLFFTLFSRRLRRNKKEKHRSSRSMLLCCKNKSQIFD